MYKSPGARRHSVRSLVVALALVGLGPVGCGGGASGQGPTTDRPGTGGKASGNSGSGGAGGGTTSGSGGSASTPGRAGGASGTSEGSGGATGAGTGGAARDAGATPETAPASDARPDTRSPGGSTGSPPANISDAGSPAAGPAGPWARAVTVGLVEVTQAVFVKIGEGGTVLEPAMRNAPIIEGRPLFIRAYAVPGAGFQARRLRAVATVDYGGGVTKAVEDAKMISAASNPDRLDTTFNFLLPATDVKPGSSLSVAFYEMGEAAGADPSPVPRFPTTGAADLAVKAGRMVLDVVAMPVSGPTGALADTPERRAKLIADLYDVYPVQKVNLRVREPMVVTAKITSSSMGFTALREARTKDGAKPWEYYHLLVGSADCNFSFAGVASGAGAGVNDASRRVAITKVGQRALDGNTNTTAHEIGHNHGRNHAPACGASGGDTMFPYEMGGLGVNGFSLSTMTLKSKAMFKELMGYCRPRWISDYTYKMLEVRVRAVSAFPGNGDGAPPPMAQEERSLQAYAGPGEAPQFGVVPGHLVPDGTAVTGARLARLHLADGRVVEAAVGVQLLTDDVTRELTVNLPRETVVRAEITVDGQTFVADVD